MWFRNLNRNEQEEISSANWSGWVQASSGSYGFTNTLKFFPVMSLLHWSNMRSFASAATPHLPELPVPFLFNASCSWSSGFACLTHFTRKERAGFAPSYSLLCIPDPPPDLLALKIRTPVWNRQVSEMWGKPIHVFTYLSSPLLLLAIFEYWALPYVLCLHLCPPHLNL